MPILGYAARSSSEPLSPFQFERRAPRRSFAQASRPGLHFGAGTSVKGATSLSWASVAWGTWR